MPSTTHATWTERADLVQHSLEKYFGAPGEQLLHNTCPSEPGDDEVFNYWWLAHLIDVRVDAFERTGDPVWLAKARDAHDNILTRKFRDVGVAVVTGSPRRKRAKSITYVIDFGGFQLTH